ncbi:DUF2795 domain-containing protein [Azotobacter chroococcum]|uniref:DUF2795 domain-containing protein n=1 Tax=Azotobacter chroococcum TaxID=353 RepID=UPI00103B0955|nr:DUF2795 domain-containing protein [Azotobacter chroococcum]TBV91301.1 DUF2795 domain-containing protein [Azotobacter chroococcum]
MTRGLGGQSPANVAYYLKGIDFPASRDQILKHAEGNGAESAVIDKINQLPDVNYEDMADVMKGYGEEFQDER